MPTTVLLIRHALTDAVGAQLTGRLAGVPLNETGRRQAADLPRRLGARRLAAVYASPLERAQQTAAPLAAAAGCPVETVADVNEVAFGGWTGRTLASLDADPAWIRYNAVRSLTAAPGGESMLAVQARAVLAVEAAAARHEHATIAVVSHGDVVRALVMLFLGMPVDFLHRLDIAPASISIVELGGGAPRVKGVNLLGAI